MGLWGTRREVVTRDALSCERGRQCRKTLCGRSALAGESRGRHRAILHGKERLPSHPIEDPHVSRLGDLGDRVDAPAIVHNADEHRCRREIAVPKIMM